MENFLPVYQNVVASTLSFYFYFYSVRKFKRATHMKIKRMMTTTRNGVRLALEAPKAV